MMLRSKNRLLSPPDRITPKKRTDDQNQSAADSEKPIDGTITSDNIIDEAIDSPMTIASAALSLLNSGDTTMPEPEATGNSSTAESTHHATLSPTAPAATTNADDHPTISDPTTPPQAPSLNTLSAAILAAATTTTTNTTTTTTTIPSHAHSHRLLYHLIQSTNILHSLLHAFLSLEALQRDVHAIASASRDATTAPPVGFYPMMLGTEEMMRDMLKNAVVCKGELEKLVEWEGWVKEERARWGKWGGLRCLKVAVEGMEWIMALINRGIQCREDIETLRKAGDELVALCHGDASREMVGWKGVWNSVMMRA